jgi:phosphoenolpyruvate carboxykinase (diphosphate)
VPELWCRMRVAERDASFLIENGYLEKVTDLDFNGRKVKASRLGYRITASFVDRFLGRIFEMPGAVFPEELLRPEKQDLAVFAEGVDAIVEAQRLVSLNYFEDCSVEAACPPIKALLHIMAHGHYRGMDETDPRLRAMFTRESLLNSDWYRERLLAKQNLDVKLWRRHNEALAAFVNTGMTTPHLDLDARLEAARLQLARVSSGAYLAELVGTIGADPFVTAA